MRLAVFQCDDAFTHMFHLGEQAIADIGGATRVGNDDGFLDGAVGFRHIDEEGQVLAVVLVVGFFSIHGNLFRDGGGYDLYFEGSLCGHVFVASFAWADLHGQRVAGSFGGERCGGIAFLVVFVVSVVFVHAELAPLSRKHAYGDGVVVTAQVVYFSILGYDGSGLDVDGCFVELEGSGEGLSAFEECSGGGFIPVVAGGQPHFLFGASVLRGGGDGAYDHLIAEHVLCFVVVGFLAFWVVVVHGSAE